MKYIWIISLLALSLNLSAQEDSSIVQSFDTLVLNSNSWQEFRVIKKEDLSRFKKELMSTSKDLINEINSLKGNIKKLEDSLATVKAENDAVKTELSAMKNAKDEMNLIGLTLPKSTYLILVWSIIGVLMLISIFIFIKYRNRNIVTEEIKENLENTTKEFEDYKHRAIEKQQKLGRELLDTQKLLQARNQKK